MADTQYIVSALKHRPVRFREVLAQDHITRTLKHSLERNQIANAYIFAGPRGTGKTTTARILAKALNCQNLQDSEPCNECDSCRSITRGVHPDVLEIDAASNRGVDNIEQLRENAKFTPTMGTYKVYIIDECHMLSTPANNALLKTLEEPPKYTKFLFATTELHKLLPTILSRCQLFQFRRIPTNIIVDHLTNVLSQQSDLEIAEEDELSRILFLIARSSEGGLRDALGSLDQFLAFCSGKLRLSEVEEILGVVEFDVLDSFIRAIIQHNLQDILQIIDGIVDRGREIEWFLKESQQYLRNLTVLKISPDNKKLLDLPQEYIDRLQDTAEETSIEQILYMIDMLWEAERRMHFSSESRMIFEMAAIKAAKAGQAASIPQLLKDLASGKISAETSTPVIAPSPASQPPQRVETMQEPSPIPAPEPLPNTSGGTLPEMESQAEPAKHEPVPPSKPLTCDLLSSSWNSLLQELETKHQFLAAILEGSRPLSIEDQTVMIALPSKQKPHLKRLERADNKQVLEETLSSAYGRKLRFKIEFQDDMVPAANVPQPMAVPTPQPDERSKAELVTEVEKNETFSKLLDTLPGRILDIKPVSKS